MTDTTISKLEQAIRDRAYEAAQKKALDNLGLIRSAIPGGWDLGQAMERAVHAYIVAGRKDIGDMAVRQFMSTYQNLIGQYPEVVAQVEQLEQERE